MVRRHFSVFGFDLVNLDGKKVALRFFGFLLEKDTKCVEEDFFLFGGNLLEEAGEAGRGIWSKELEEEEEEEGRIRCPDFESEFWDERKKEGNDALSLAKYYVKENAVQALKADLFFDVFM